MIVRKFRNHIAHNLDFINYRECTLKSSANKLFSDNLVNDNEMENPFNNVWGMILAIIILLNNDYLAYNFLAELNSFLIAGETFTDIYCKVVGIPLDYEKRIKKYHKTLEFKE